MTLGRSNEATSALFERFLDSGNSSSQTMENACDAASTRNTFVSSIFHKRVSRSYDNLNQGMPCRTKNVLCFHVVKQT